jgi:myo-inositol-1(or 4)-monophosphatase
MTADEEAVERVAVAAALAAGTGLRERYGPGAVEAEFRTDDVKAAADRAAERAILPVLRRAFPSHRTYAEESGRLPAPETDDENDWRWIVDPLDGTNDFAAGLPTFAVGVAALRDDEPRVAVVHLPATDETYVARAGEGVRYAGERVRAESDLDPATATVATVVGMPVVGDPDLRATADAFETAVGERVKRVVDTWAPLVHAGLLARGRLQGLTAFHPDPEEGPAMELLAREAGARTAWRGSLWLAAVDDATLDALLAAAEEAGAGVAPE